MKANCRPQQNRAGLPSDLQGKRILLIKQSSLGDVVHTLPVVHSLKRCFPSCVIGWVIERAFMPLIQGDSAVDHCYPLHIPSTSSPGAAKGVYWHALQAMVQTIGTLRHEFRQAPYDLVLDLHASFRSGIFSWLNPHGLRIGFAGAKEGNTFFQHQTIAVPQGVEHAVEKNSLFSRFLGCEVKKEDFFLQVAETDVLEARTFRATHGINEEHPLVYINATARWQSKFWLAERWAQLADRLLAQGIQVVFGGSAGERLYLEQIAASMNAPACIAAGGVSLGAAAALMKQAQVYAGLDTGPMHIAAMAGTPVVALFGPTHPERVGPYGVDHAVLQAENVDCLCCRKRTCQEPRCMQGIGVDVVYEQIIKFIQQHKPNR